MVALSDETQKLLAERMQRGGYASAEDVILAGLAMLEQQEHLSSFAPGELDAMLAVADAEIERGEVLDGETVFEELRKRGRYGRAG